MLYEKLGLDDNQNNNSSIENFEKWIVDELVLNNYDLAIQVWETNWAVILEGLKQLASWEWIKQMAQSIWESFTSLFTWNAYEKWKSVAELWLIWTWVWAGVYLWKKWVKLWMKEISKLRVKKENLVSSIEVKEVIWDVHNKLDDILPKKELDFEAELNKNWVDSKEIIDWDIQIIDIDNISRENFLEIKNIVDNMSSVELLDFAKKHEVQIFENYNRKHWNIVNLDDFRDYIWWEVWISANKTQEGASYLAEKYFMKILTENQWKGNNTIKFLAWWPWSGKWSMSQINNNTWFSWVLDGTLKTLDNAEKNIKLAQEFWYNIRIEYVVRDLNESFLNWVLTRAINQNISWFNKYGINGLWRTVPLDLFERWHIWARNTIKSLYNTHWDSIVKIFTWSEENLRWTKWIINSIKSWTHLNLWPQYINQLDFEYLSNTFDNNFNKQGAMKSIQKALILWKINKEQSIDLKRYK
jgi:hypothetical protein